MGVRQYQDLIAWQKAMDLVVCVYKITDEFPRKEMFGLTNQLRRAAVSVHSNIAEGQARSTVDFVRYLSVARGSLQEIETQILIACRLDYIKASQKPKLIEMIAEVGRLLRGLSKSLSDPDCP